MDALTEDFNSLAIPNSQGVYILHLELARSRSLTIGRLGSFSFQPGEYLYVGSALGPGGLKSRLGRHLHGSERRHWHIDWLRPFTLVRGYFYLATSEHLECTWNQVLMHQPGACTPVPGFGASDCRNEPTPCAAHLVWFDMGIDKYKIRGNLPGDQGSTVVNQELTSYNQPDFGDIG